ncbi:MAG: hypothetical protein WCS62_02385 [Bacilli bacterium]|jgi:antitoxin component of MazEF toxin-antitoxin module
MKLPIIRKLTTVGASRGISLPKSWIENAEAEAGKKIVAIALEVGRVITVSPVFEKEVKENEQDPDNP